MKKVKLFEQFIAEKKTKEDYEDIIDDLESKIWEIENTKASWIPDTPAKKNKMIQTYQKKIDAAKKALSKLDESAINEARAPKTKEELISALDDAYSKLDKYNKKYYEINRAPGGGSWSSNSKEGKAALKYKKMANNQQANIWKWTDKLRKLGFEYSESSVTEKREDVGKYNTVKKVVAKLGRRPSEQDLAQFINDNYYDVTEVERGEDDPRANDKIADLVAFYKFDIDDWEIAWEDAQNESIVGENKEEMPLDWKFGFDYMNDPKTVNIKYGRGKK